MTEFVVHFILFALLITIFGTAINFTVRSFMRAASSKAAAEIERLRAAMPKKKMSDELVLICGPCSHGFDLCFLPIDAASLGRQLRNAECIECGGSELSVSVWSSDQFEIEWLREALRSVVKTLERTQKDQHAADIQSALNVARAVLARETAND